MPMRSSSVVVTRLHHCMHIRAQHAACMWPDAAPLPCYTPCRWVGGDQEDVHEFFCALLELLQQEVLSAERAATGNASAPVWTTLDPVTRNFSGTLLKRFTCRWARASGAGQGSAAGCAWLQCCRARLMLPGPGLQLDAGAAHCC